MDQMTLESQNRWRTSEGMRTPWEDGGKRREAGEKRKEKSLRGGARTPIGSILSSWSKAHQLLYITQQNTRVTRIYSKSRVSSALTMPIAGWFVKENRLPPSSCLNGTIATTERIEVAFMTAKESSPSYLKTLRAPCEYASMLLSAGEYIELRARLS